jgi:SAM-dependent methyltransferase
VAVVGAGASALIGDLVRLGYRNVEAIDVSDAALDQLRLELGEDAALVAMRRADVRTLTFDKVMDVWHDRAVFHFLIDKEDQAAYVDRATAAVRPGGHLLIATFALDGPERCSDLPVQRYDAASLEVAFTGGFDLVDAFDHLHRTPWGAQQPFVHTLFRRRDETV